VLFAEALADARAKDAAAAAGKPEGALFGIPVSFKGERDAWINAKDRHEQHPWRGLVPWLLAVLLQADRAGRGRVHCVYQLA
jgi:hypothetical protein